MTRATTDLPLWLDLAMQIIGPVAVLGIAVWFCYAVNKALCDIVEEMEE